jgi:sulfatase modifying factor 1
MPSVSASIPDDMVPVPGGRFMMGSDNFYPEEAPVRQAQVGPFLMDRHLVTNAQFARFVAATSYVTLAERAPDPKLYPGMLPERTIPGSIVFVQPENDGKQFGPETWWQFRAGANWRAPYGPDSGVQVPHDHPVVQIAFEDAAAYAAWAGKRLPTEEEAEFAARGGLDGVDYAWGKSLAPDGVEMANIWLRGFPFERARPGPPYTSPVGSYAPNAYGLYDLIGNVWEWTGSDADAAPGAKSCCSADVKSLAPSHRKILKGGSHLCAPNYCRRYRPAAIWPQPIDTSTTHVGFRCARDVARKA